jgi:hypothetical protein
MSCQESVPKISAQNFPVSGMCKKRAFQAEEKSNFNDIKRRRLNSGVEGIKLRLTSEEIELQRLQKEKEEIERQKMMYDKYYNKIKNARPSVTTPSLYSNSGSRNETPKLTNNRNDDDMELDDVSKRPKFKARPLPKSIYAPQFTIKHSDKPLTMPIGFNLSTGNSSSQGLSYKEESTSFKARPLNKNILEKPDFVPQLGFTTPSSAAISNRNTPTPNSLDNRLHKRQNSSSPAPSRCFIPRSEERARRSQSISRNFESEISSDCIQRSFPPNPFTIFTPPSDPQPSPFSYEKLHSETYISSYQESCSAFSARFLPNISEPFRFGSENVQSMEIEQSTDPLSTNTRNGESYNENSETMQTNSHNPFSNGQTWDGFKPANSFRPHISSNYSSEFDLYKRICGEDSVYSNTEETRMPPNCSIIHDEDMLNSS